MGLLDDDAPGGLDSGGLFKGLLGVGPTPAPSVTAAAPVPTMAQGAAATPVTQASGSDPSSMIYNGFYSHAIQNGASPDEAKEFAHLGLGTAGSEGLHEKNVWSNTGDGGKSWGPFQLYTGGGLGNKLGGDMSPQNQIRVAAQVMWGAPGNNGEYDTRPWNGLGDRLAGHRVGRSDLNQSDEAQQLAISRGQGIAAKLGMSPGVSTAMGSSGLGGGYSLPASVAGAPDTSLGGYNAPGMNSLMAVNMPAGTNEAPAPHMVASGVTPNAVVPPPTVQQAQAQTWAQKAADLQKLMGQGQKDLQAQQQKPQQQQPGGGYNAYLSQHNQMVEALARQLAQKTFRS